MTLTILIGAAILLSAGYNFAIGVPRYIRVPGWPNPPRPGPRDDKYAARPMLGGTELCSLLSRSADHCDVEQL